jgi:anti-sigma-K factor RskA
MKIDALPPEPAGHEPPEDPIAAGEYVLGVLSAADRRAAQSRIASDPAFARLVADWERRFAPWLDEIAAEPVPTHVWPQLRRRLGWAAVEPAPPRGLWNSVGFWRGVAGLATAAAIAAVFVGPAPTPVPTPAPTPTPIVVAPLPEEQAAKPVTTLARDDGSAGWLASVDPVKGTVLMVPVPAPADAQGRAPELWLIPAGGAPASLGLVSIDKSHTVAVPAALRDRLVQGSLLAITLEPAEGAPHAGPTGPIIAKGAILQL